MITFQCHVFVLPLIYASAINGCWGCNKDAADPDGQNLSQSHKRFLNNGFRRDSSLENFGALRKMDSFHEALFVSLLFF